MRLTRYFLPVLKENPAEAQIVSHRFMLRAGMIKQQAAGIYSWLPMGFRVLRRIEATSRGLLSLEQGSLYPALQRIQHRGLIESEWGTSENNRRAKFYRLTRSGEARLERETTRWAHMVEAVSNVLVARPSEV